VRAHKTSFSQHFARIARSLMSLDRDRKIPDTAHDKIRILSPAMSDLQSCANMEPSTLLRSRDKAVEQ
jgi:hypothetical protein